MLLRAVSGNLEGVAEIISQSDRRALELAVSALKAGELVVYPTDTVYGLGAADGNGDAVRGLFGGEGGPCLRCGWGLAFPPGFPEPKN